MLCLFTVKFVLQNAKCVSIYKASVESDWAIGNLVERCPGLQRSQADAMPLRQGLADIESALGVPKE